MTLPVTLACAPRTGTNTTSPGLEADIGGIDAAEQVLVDVDRVHQGPAPTDLDPAEAAVRAGSAGGVERGEYGTGAGDLVGAGPDHVARHIDLDVLEPRDGELEPRRRLGAAAHARVDPAKPGVELLLELTQREVGDVDLAHLGNDDEPLTGHLERVHPLDVPREDQHQHVAGTEPVVRVHRPRLRRLELRGELSERLQAENLETPGAERLEGIGQRIGSQRIQVDELEGIEDLPQRIRNLEQGVAHLERVRLRRRENAEGSHCVEGSRARSRFRGGVRAWQILVQDIIRIPGRPKPGAHLVFGQARLGQLLPELLHQYRAGSGACRAPRPASGAAGWDWPGSAPGPKGWWRTQEGLHPG